MKTIITLALGAWLGHKIYSTLADNRVRERNVELRKRLEGFLLENAPALSSRQINQAITDLLK